MVAIFRKRRYFDKIFMIFETWDRAAEWGLENIDEEKYEFFTISNICKLRACWHNIFNNN